MVLELLQKQGAHVDKFNPPPYIITQKKKKKKSDPPVLVFNMYTRSWLSSYVEMNIYI